MTDFEAWMELCDLYLAVQDYTKAAFCMEELIMSNPHNHLYHQKFAEVCIKGILHVFIVIVEKFKKYLRHSH